MQWSQMPHGGSIHLTETRLVEADSAPHFVTMGGLACSFLKAVVIAGDSLLPEGWTSEGRPSAGAFHG